MKPNLWRIAYFGPLPPMRSGVADYSYKLLPYLARLADITLFVADWQVSHPLAERFTIHPIERYPLIRQDYDVAIYQMGNSEYHQGFYSMLLRYPGIVVLHEYFLHHLAAYTIGQGSYARYAQEIGYALGLQGLEIAHQVLQVGIAHMPAGHVPAELIPVRMPAVRDRIPEILEIVSFMMMPGLMPG